MKSQPVHTTTAPTAPPASPMHYPIEHAAIAQDVLGNQGNTPLYPSLNDYMGINLASLENSNSAVAAKAHQVAARPMVRKGFCKIYFRIKFLNLLLCLSSMDHQPLSKTDRASLLRFPELQSDLFARKLLTESER
jgi:hypothetical protein